MGSRNFEWIRLCDEDSLPEVARVLQNTDPRLWNLVPGACQYVQNIDEAPGWYLPVVFVALDGQCGVGIDGLRILGKYWIYEVDAVEHDPVRNVEYFCRIGRLAVREVPSVLVLNCSLTILHGSGHFAATFTTLGGSEVFRTQRTFLPLVLTVGCLIRLIKGTVQARGFLQSKNQQIRLFLNGSPAHLSLQTVLWNRIQNNGWLQQSNSAIDGAGS